MQYEVIFAGFGGQGVLAIGQILAMAAMEEGKQVVWLPSYGPEMRGGTANCTVVFSDKPVGSPLVECPTAAVVMNRPSFDKFAPRVKEGGLLIVNSSMIDVRSDRREIDQLFVPVTELAIEAGHKRSANLAILGAFVERSGILCHDSVVRAIREKMGAKQEILEINLKAFHLGAQAAQTSTATWWNAAVGAV